VNPLPHFQQFFSCLSARSANSSKICDRGCNEKSYKLWKRGNVAIIEIVQLFFEGFWWDQNLEEQKTRVKVRWFFARLGLNMCEAFHKICMKARELPLNLYSIITLKKKYSDPMSREVVNSIFLVQKLVTELFSLLFSVNGNWVISSRLELPLFLRQARNIHFKWQM
jgi:hypothetical protein